ncbi:MAG: hypothetical protein SGJ04_10370 [Bacteroidota bacterium]|nr:hypothetical protein [Bacteroidota bacterium]
MNAKTSIKLTIAILAIVIAFLISISVKLIPYDITWGGRIKSDNEMYVFESISILINVLVIFALLLKGNYIKLNINAKIVNAVLWFFFMVFILNTIGNLFAATVFEKLFSILTLLLAALIRNILKRKNSVKTAY